MTRDEIIKLASQAIDDTRSEVDLPVPFVLRFAALGHARRLCSLSALDLPPKMISSTASLRLSVPAAFNPRKARIES